MRGRRRVGDGRSGNLFRVELAAGIVVVLVALATTFVVLGVFVWAAIKDGEEDRALQKRLGIRRRTRLGR
jgi:hypothetical protein